MSVFGLVSAVAGFLKVQFLIDKEVIDNAIFRCHYRLTSAILFVCCILCTATSLLGKPIDCLGGDAFKGKENVINTYCWITSTFTLATREGIGPYVHGVDKTTHHAYYQWVPFMLFFQGVLFYTPHWIWKNWEEGKVKMISNGLRGFTVACKEKRKDPQNKLVNYLIQSMHLHNGYALQYFICEFLNFVNVVANIFFLDKFLGGVFLEYGTKVIAFSAQDQEERIDPMIEVFPRLTKCLFHKYGHSGTVETLDALCILPLNILNEKIFIFLWFWFIGLAVVTGLALCYSIALAIFPDAQRLVIERRFKYRTPAGISHLLTKLQVGDFLLLHLLGQNMCTNAYHDLLEELSTRLNHYNSVSTAPSTLEMRPLYPTKDQYKDIDA